MNHNFSEGLIHQRTWWEGKKKKKPAKQCNSGVGIVQPLIHADGKDGSYYYIAKSPYK